VARLFKKIDENLLRDLASIHCTTEEMALILKCSKDTLERRFMHIMEEGRSKGKMSLRRAQFKSALEGQPMMLKWLGQNLLGQKDFRDIEQSVNPATRKEIDDLKDQLRQVMKDE